MLLMWNIGYIKTTLGSGSVEEKNQQRFRYNVPGFMPSRVLGVKTIFFI